MNKEPAVIVNAVTAFITAAIGVLVAFGVDVTEDQRNAILGLVAAISTLILIAGPIIRQYVTPVEKAEAKIDEAFAEDPDTGSRPTLESPVVVPTMTMINNTR